MVTIGTEAKIKAWTPPASCKVQDNIISSDHTSTKAFIPSYEKERRPCIELLLSNEYQRIWWREKKAWEKAVIPKSSSKKLLPRMVVKKKPKKDGGQSDSHAIIKTTKRSKKAANSNPVKKE